MKYKVGTFLLISEVVQLYYDADNGQFWGKRSKGIDIKAASRADLIEKLEAADKRAVRSKGKKATVPVFRIHNSSVIRGVGVGVHEGNGNLMVKWADEKMVKQDQGWRGVYPGLTDGQYQELEAALSSIEEAGKIVSARYC